MAETRRTTACAFLRVAVFVLLSFLAPQAAHAAPYAAVVMDARDGRIIFARNHDTRLHPASLTKMMTLYIAFEAIKHGEISLDTPVRISGNAAGTACSCLGVRAGQTIALRYLIRAAALRSGNDAAVAIAEAISGSESAFAERMTRTARAMGMENTTFRNPHGLTAPGHLSTARDMTILGRQLYFDFPQYYNIFSRRSDHAGIATVPNTNRALLDAYRGADGIKTGFTRAAGFNLTASAQRGDVRIIATMFGGASGASRNAHVAELLDMGFARAESRVAMRAPATPAYQGRAAAVARAPAASAENAGTAANDRPSAGRTIRLQTAVTRSPRPPARPVPGMSEPPEDLLLAVQQSVGAALASVASDAETAAAKETEIAAASEATDGVAELAPAALPVIPPARPADIASAAESADPVATDLELAEAAGFQVLPPEEFAALLDNGGVSEIDMAPEAERSLAAAQDAVDVALGIATQDAAAPSAEADQQAAAATIVPAALTTPAPATSATASTTATQPAPPRPNELIILTSAEDAPDDHAQVAMVTETFAATPGSEIVSRMSTSGGRIWGVTLGSFPSRHDAERALIQTSLSEAVALENGLRRIRQGGGGFEASFAGLTRDEAEMACRRIAARQRTCFTVSP